MHLRRAAVILLLAALPAAARVLPPGIRPFRTYGTEAGLGSLAAMKLAQDTAGFLWVATQDGVYRYDGNRFARFGLEEGLPSSYVPNVKAAPDGSVWVMTYGGVARFDGRRFIAPFPFLPQDQARFGWQDVLEVADSCLYAAKNAGRNRTVGVIAGLSNDPDTLVQRIRNSLHDVVASGEVTLATNDTAAIAV